MRFLKPLGVAALRDFELPSSAAKFINAALSKVWVLVRLVSKSSKRWHTDCSLVARNSQACDVGGIVPPLRKGMTGLRFAH